MLSYCWSRGPCVFLAIYNDLGYVHTEPDEFLTRWIERTLRPWSRSIFSLPFMWNRLNKLNFNFYQRYNHLSTRRFSWSAKSKLKSVVACVAGGFVRKGRWRVAKPCRRRNYMGALKNSFVNVWGRVLMDKALYLQNSYRATVILLSRCKCLELSDRRH